jgi:6-phosphofructokinase
MSAPLPRTVKGKRPDFHDNASVDRLIAMVLALTSEVAVLRDRVVTLEALGREAGWLGAGAVEAYAPDGVERVARDGWREAYLARVFHILREELDDLETASTADSYWSTIERIERGDV